MRSQQGNHRKNSDNSQYIIYKLYCIVNISNENQRFFLFLKAFYEPTFWLLAIQPMLSSVMVSLRTPTVNKWKYFNQSLVKGNLKNRYISTKTQHHCFEGNSSFSKQIYIRKYKYYLIIIKSLCILDGGGQTTHSKVSVTSSSYEHKDYTRALKTLW